MKRIFITLILLLFCTSYLSAQETENDTTKTHYTISTGLGFGSGFWGDSFTSSHLSFGITHQINSDLRLRANATTGTFSSSLLNNNESKAPFRNPNNRIAASVTADYQIYPKMWLSVSVFHDYINIGSSYNFLHTSHLYTTAVNANLTYKLRNDSFINFSLTFMETNNPYTYFNPYIISPMNDFMLMPYHNSFHNGGFLEW
jgi:hypothetical protein